MSNYKEKIKQVFICLNFSLRNNVLLGDISD